MLNPSTADEIKNDPTVERCERRARHHGFGAFTVCNIFAWRATDPRDMRAAADPVGAGNDEAILQNAAQADLVVCAWGTHGAHTPLHHLGLSKAGHPKHPLYISYDVTPMRWV